MLDAKKRAYGQAPGVVTPLTTKKGAVQTAPSYRRETLSSARCLFVHAFANSYSIELRISGLLFVQVCVE